MSVLLLKEEVELRGCGGWGRPLTDVMQLPDVQDCTILFL